MQDLQKSIILEELMEKIWSFCSLINLEKWHSLLYEMSPYCILDDHPEAMNSFRIISREKAEQLKNEYLKLPPFIVSIIDEVISIGYNNMYSGVVGLSEQTLRPLRDIVKIMEENNFMLPDLNPFLKSDFTEDGGWGYPHNREFYLK